jgi:hypothetical protein
MNSTCLFDASILYEHRQKWPLRDLAPSRVTSGSLSRKQRLTILDDHQSLITHNGEPPRSHN